MNSAIVSELSLFQMAQEFDPSLESVAISATTLKSCIKTILDLAIEQQLKTTIWAKSTQTNNWFDELQKYQQQGDCEYLYLCSSHKNHSAASFEEIEERKFIPLHLKHNSWLQRESFFVLIASNFCALILAQWQKGKINVGASGKRLEQPYLYMISSFDSQVVQNFLWRLQSLIINPADVISPNNFTIANPDHWESKLLTSLLLKQIKHSENLQTVCNSSLATVPSQSESISAILGLPENFLDNLVRELQSPITHIKTALSLLESKQVKGEQRQRYLQMVNDECDRQNSLVSGLLDLLQLDRTSEIESLKLDDFVPGIVSTYQPLAEEKQIQLGYTIPANLPPISCPISWLRQIMIHLLNNSLQFTPPEGRVFVQATLKDQYVELSVNDTGIGIETKELPKIFDGFYRTKSNPPQKLAGAGLGLTIVRQLVHRCGGNISVNSKPGKGSNFKVLLPAIPLELVD